MLEMSRLRRHVESVPVLVSCCLILSLGQGCARQQPSHPGDASLASSQQELPFHPEQVLADDVSHPAVPEDSKAASTLPFHSEQQPRILPSGTLLTVQLEDPLSTAKVRPGDTFLASVAAPLTIDGRVLVDHGTAVTGHVESAQSKGPSPGGILSPGYFRLTLTAMTVEGKPVALQTSSLFTRANLPALDVRSVGVRVQKGRRLTFRLTAPAMLPTMLNDRNSMADRQLLVPASEQKTAGR